MADMDPKNVQNFEELDEDLYCGSEETVHLSKATPGKVDVHENNKNEAGNVEPELLSDNCSIDNVLKNDDLLDSTSVPSSHAVKTEPCTNEAATPVDNRSEDFLSPENTIFSIHGININSSLTCDICNSVYTDMEGFDVHMERHMECRFFPCQLCNKTYSSWQNLVAHRRAWHCSLVGCKTCSQCQHHVKLGPVNYPVTGRLVGCEECRAGFDSVSELYRQIVTPNISKESRAKDSDCRKLLEASPSTGRCQHSPSQPGHNCEASASEPLAKHRLQKNPDAPADSESRPAQQTGTPSKLPTMFRCFNCKTSFGSMPELQKHIRQTHSKNPGRQITCVSCGCSVTVQGFIARYVATRALKSDGELAEKDAAIYKKCRKILPNAAALKEHMLRHGEMKLEFCCVCMPSYKALEERMRKSNVQLEKDSGRVSEQQPRKVYVCEYCSRQFARKSFLRLHVKRHLGEKPHNCSQCGKSFYTFQQLNTHRLVHTKSAAHKCPTCGKSFATPHTLAAHCRTHNKYKVIFCSHCDKEFSWYSEYITHLRDHAKMRLFKCKSCFQSFASETLLFDHQQQKHLALHCSACQLLFTDKESLGQHVSQGCDKGTEQSKTSQGNNIESSGRQEQLVTADHSAPQV